MCAGVGDRVGRLRGEQHQDLLVVGRELVPAFLRGEEEVADVHAPVTHRRRLQGLRQHQVRRVAERAKVRLQIRHPERSRKVAQVLEEAHRVGPLHHLLLLGGREAGGDEVLRLPRVVDGRDHPVAGARQGAGAVDGFAQDGAQVETRADTQDSGTQAGDALAQRVGFPSLLVAGVQWPLLLPGGRWSGPG